MIMNKLITIYRIVNAVIAMHNKKSDLHMLFSILAFPLIISCISFEMHASRLTSGTSNVETIPESQVITISSSSDFSKFYGMLCEGNTFSGRIVMLDKDISFDTGGKSGTRNFEGTFDGQGHKLSDVTSSLFNNNSGEIRNLNIASGTLTGSGIFCQVNNGSIVNCSNAANISYSSSSSSSSETGISAGALCTSNYGSIINCVNRGSVNLELIAIYGYWSKVTSSCGGICAYSGNGSSIVNCTNEGNINNSGIYFAITGGIVANSDHALIVGCENRGLVYSYILNSSPSKGNVSVQSYQHQHVGGIAGHVLYSVINRCKNYGTVKSNFQYLGGIAGYVGNSDVYNLENYGDIEG